MAMAEASGEGVRTIPQRMTQQYIASRVGAQRDMVSRVCSQLVRGGYIAVTDRQYAILRPLPERF
jgi:CRP-like cAMP-binding protein